MKKMVWFSAVLAIMAVLPSILFPLEMFQDLKGKIAVVTGGSRGLGRGVVQALVEVGATVYVTGRTETSLVEACESAKELGSGICIPKVVDSANDTDIDGLFEEIRNTHGKLDILVNNAYSGISYWKKDKLLGKAFWEAPMQLYDEIFRVGVRSHYKASRLAVPLMQKQGGGLIINTNSPGCILYAINVPYGMGKCAVDKMTADMAMELATENIDVVSYWPGVLQTDEIKDGNIDVDIPRRGVAPGLQFFPKFGSLYNTALAETLLGSGRGIVQYTMDKQRSWYSGLVLVSTQLVSRYGVVDERGIRSPNAFLTVKGVLTTAIPPLRTFAQVENPETLSSPPTATFLQRLYFNTIPDGNIPIWLFKIISGVPLTMPWPIP